MSSTTSARSSFLIVSTLIFSAATAAAQQEWDPSLQRRHVDQLVKPRAPRNGPLRSRLAKRQNSQNPGQPVHVASDDKIGGFAEIGTSGVSAQQLYLGTADKVYIVDKVENNPTTVNGHPAWATEYDLLTNQIRAMDVTTNTFCAGGAYLGDGRLINIGGNQAVVPGGDAVVKGSANPYQNEDGAFAVRTLIPGNGNEWSDVRADDL
jgi:hypothetical protein